MSPEIKDLNIALSSGDPVVENISFQLEKSKMFSIIGSSGAGKTTICKVIMGLLGSTYRAKGSILFHGRELLTLPGRGRRIVYGREICPVIQDPMTAFNPSIRVGHQLERAYRLRHSKISRRETYEPFSNLLQRLRLEDTIRILNNYPFTLSGGMFQRLMVAATLMNKPPLLVTDEATTATDTCNRIGLIWELKGLYHEGMSALFVTHGLHSASVSDRILVADHGQVVEQGTAEQISMAPPRDYTKHLLNVCRLERREWI